MSMIILKVLLVVSAALHYAILKCRFWIIRQLVGKRVVMMNVTMKGGSVHLPPDAQAYISDCTFEGPKDGAVFVAEQ
jgi:hypothetical protein